MILGIGLLAGLDYLVSFAYGEGNLEKAQRWVVQALLLSVLGSVVLTLMLLFLAGHLEWFAIDASILPEAERYLSVLAYSLFPVFGFAAIRQFLQALGVVRPSVAILVGANVVNILAHYLLVFGRFGFPALGAQGSAWATVISRFLMFFAILGYWCWWDRRKHRLLSFSAFQFDLNLSGKLLRLGMPAALQMTFEVGVFALVTIMAGRLGSIKLAAHQVVINIVSLTFMVPLGISSATAVLVGQNLGRQKLHEASRAGWRGLQLGIIFMALSSVVLLLWPQTILSFYTIDKEVIGVATGILFLGAIFQIFDGMQVVATGALRGKGNTRTPMAVHMLAHWVVGLPVGLYLCFHAGFDLLGLWIGLSLGLVTAAVTLFIKWWQTTLV
jgi:MATE family multidrug resistance protein